MPLSPYFDLKKDSDGNRFMEVYLDGIALLRLVLTNKGTAFTQEERISLKLEGLLPPRVETLADQVKRVYVGFKRQYDDIERYQYLRNLQERQEILFYALLVEHLEEMLLAAVGRRERQVTAPLLRRLGDAHTLHRVLRVQVAPKTRRVHGPPARQPGSRLRRAAAGCVVHLQAVQQLRELSVVVLRGLLRGQYFIADHRGIRGCRIPSIRASCTGGKKALLAAEKRKKDALLIAKKRCVIGFP